MFDVVISLDWCNNIVQWRGGCERVGGDRGNMNDSECECSSLQYFLGEGIAGYHRRGFFCQQIVDRRKKWDTDKRDCNKLVLLSVAVDAVAI